MTSVPRRGQRLKGKKVLEAPEWIKRILVDTTPLRLNSLGENNSLLVSAFISPAQCHSPIAVDILIDCGCSSYGFSDRSFVKQHQIETSHLARPRRVVLADGVTCDSVTEYFIVPMSIGHHRELALFFVTNLAHDNPLILGVPWLKIHNPDIDWPAMRMLFSSDHCRRNCLPPRLPTSEAYAPSTPRSSLRIVSSNYKTPKIGRAHV